MPPRSGYTLPVFACAAAVAALQQLKHGRSPARVEIDLLEPPKTVEIAIEQAAKLNSGMALAIARSDPGDNLDITRDTPIWALVESGVGSRESGVGIEAGAPTIPATQTTISYPPIPEPPPKNIIIKGGEGLGRIVDAGDRPAIYAYAQHYSTFVALLKLWGLPPELASPISNQLANIDNTEQDKLIQLFAVELQKKQSPSEK